MRLLQHVADLAWRHNLEGRFAVTAALHDTQTLALNVFAYVVGRVMNLAHACTLMDEPRQTSAAATFRFKGSKL
jgi:hypothetical protein